MVKSSVRFERGDGYWVAERDSIGFTGTTDFGPVEFLITSEALAEMLNPELIGNYTRGLYRLQRLYGFHWRVTSLRRLQFTTGRAI